MLSCGWPWGVVVLLIRYTGHRRGGAEVAGLRKSCRRDVEEFRRRQLVSMYMRGGMSLMGRGRSST